MDFPLATLLLAPLLIYQGRYVRRVTPRLPEPAGARSGDSANNRARSLLILGDSAAAGVGVAQQKAALSGQLLKRLGDWRWRLLATSGDASLDLLARLKEEAPCHYDVVVLSVGVNDVTSRIDSRRWLRLQQQLLTRIGELFSPHQVIFSALPPMQQFPALPQPLRCYLGRRATRFNKLLGDWLATSSHGQLLTPKLPLTTGSFAVDGFHPGAAAYALWAEQLAQAINAAGPSTTVGSPDAVISVVPAGGPQTAPTPSP